VCPDRRSKQASAQKKGSDKKKSIGEGGTFSGGWQKPSVAAPCLSASLSQLDCGISKNQTKLANTETG